MIGDQEHLPMDPEIRIVPATRRDIPLLLRFIRGLAEYEHPASKVAATEDWLRELLFGRTRGAEAVVALAGNVPAGFALCFPVCSTFRAERGLFIESLFVDRSWRGRGLGRRLLAHLAGLAVERGCEHLEWTVLDWNYRAIRFYFNLGARVVSDRKAYRIAGEPLRKLSLERTGRNVHPATVR